MLAATLLTGAGTGGVASTAAAATGDPLDVPGLYEVTGRDPGVVHLTFDDGPDQMFTPLLLDLLDGYGAKATFFPLGRNLERRWGEEEVQDLLSSGHAVGNHSLDHRRMTDMHPWAVAADLETASTLIESLAGFRPVCFRAPYGDHDDLVDSMTQAVMRFRQGNFVRLATDYVEDKREKRKREYYG